MLPAVVVLSEPNEGPDQRDFKLQTLEDDVVVVEKTLVLVVAYGAVTPVGLLEQNSRTILSSTSRQM